MSVILDTAHKYSRKLETSRYLYILKKRIDEIISKNEKKVSAY